MSWTALPAGQDVVIIPGNYAAVAMIDNGHTQADVLGAAGDYGLKVFQYFDNVAVPGQTPRAGYRFVSAQAQALGKGGTIPWSVPFPLSLANSSHLVEAWFAPIGVGPALPPAPPVSMSWLWWLVPPAALGVWWAARRLRSRRLRA